MASLTLFELKKRNNIEIFLNKIYTGQPFQLTPEKQTELDRENVILKKTQELIDSLNKITKSSSFSEDKNILTKKACISFLLLETVDGLQIPSGALQKTWEFGSKTSSMVYAKETKHRKQLASSLRLATVFGLKPVSISIKTVSGKTFSYEGVTSVVSPESIAGRLPKADFHFLGKDNAVLFKVSHKDGRKPKDFRQWSGIKDFCDHAEIKRFGQDLKSFLETQQTCVDTKIFPPTFSVAREIVDPNLKKLAIFGNESDSADFLFQGECFFTKVGDFHFEVSSNIILHKEDDLGLLPEGYQPVVLARRGDLKRGAFGIKACRSFIYPKAGRKIHKLI